jgi:hypothetical protein
MLFSFSKKIPLNDPYIRFLLILGREFSHPFDAILSHNELSMS